MRARREENSTQVQKLALQGDRVMWFPATLPCHSADESFLLLSNHAWNAALPLGLFLLSAALGAAVLTPWQMERFSLEFVSSV